MFLFCFYFGVFASTATLLETWRRGFHSRGWRRQRESCGDGYWIIPNFSIYLKSSVHRKHKLQDSLVRLVWNHLHKEPTIVARTHGCRCVDHRKVVAVDEGWAKGAEEGSAQETGCDWLLQERKAKKHERIHPSTFINSPPASGSHKKRQYGSLTFGR